MVGNLEQFANGTGNGPSVRWAQIVPGNGTKYYFAGTSTGLYSTELLNGTSTVWAQEGASTIGNVVVDMLDSRTSGGLVVVGTHGYGVFSGTVPLPLAVQEHPAVPATISLHQNYPNPFNPTTTIAYDLPSDARVVLKVYDVAGREVRTLVDAPSEAGSHAVSFDASDLSSGVYLYRLTAGSFTVTRKLTVLR